MAETSPTQLLAELVLVEVRLWDVVEARLRDELGLPLVALLPLQVVARTPGCRVQDVSREVGITVGGASKSVDRLERSGWARRSPHDTDRRSSVLSLTAEGERLLEAATLVVDEVVTARVGAVLGPTRTRQLAAALRALAVGLKT